MSPTAPQDEIHDPALGPLRRTRLVAGCRDEYAGTLQLDGEPVDLTLLSDNRRDVTPTLARARGLAGRLAPFVDAARRYAADEHVRDNN